MNGFGSNLSPLAPPFKFGKSNPNPNPNFTEPNFTDPPPYNWQYNTTHSEIDSIRTTPTTQDDYSYVDSNVVSVSRRYFTPPYARDDENTRLVALNDPRYTLSSSDLVPIEGSSRVDYTKSLVGLEYRQQWDGFWNGLGEGKRAKITEGDGAEDVNLGSSIVYKNYLDQGEPFSGKCYSSGNVGHRQSDCPGQDVRQNQLEESVGQIVPVEQAALLQVQYQNGPFHRLQADRIQGAPQADNGEPFGGKCFSCGNMGHRFSECPGRDGGQNRGPIQEPPQLEEPVGQIVPLEQAAPLQVQYQNGRFHRLQGAGLAENLNKYANVFAREGPLNTGEWDDNSFLPQNIQLTPAESSKKPIFGTGSNHPQSHIPSIESATDSWNFQKPNTPYDQRYQLFDSSTNYRVSPVVIRPPVISAPLAADKYNPSDEKAPDCNELSFFEMSNNNLAESALDRAFKSNGFSLSVDIPEAVKPTANSSDNLDSPCWKGAPSGKFPQFDEKLDGNDNSNHQETNLFPSYQEQCHQSCRIENEKNGLSHFQEVQSFVDNQVNESKTEFGFKESERAEKSTPKVDVQMLVNSMVNFSELLVFHCSNNDASALNEQDRTSLKSVLDNLVACMSNKIVQVAPAQESESSQQGATHKLGKLRNLMGASLGRPQVTNEVVAHYNGAPEEDRDGISGKKVKKFMDFNSSTKDADVSKCHNTVQAMKKVLDENLESEEELQPQALFYKNLWLEAEAQLSYNSYKARFDRVKMEMEKSDADKSKGSSTVMKKLSGNKSSQDPSISHFDAQDVPGSSTVIEKLSGLKISQDPNTSHIPTPKVNDSTKPITLRSVDNVDASVMARFNILKSRGESSHPSNGEQKQIQIVNTEFSGKRTRIQNPSNQTENRSFDMAVGPPRSHPHEQKFDDSVMARFNIIKSRGDNLMNFNNGKRNRVLFLGNQMENNGFEFGNEDKFGSYAYVPDVQSAENDQVNQQMRSGWYGKSSLDWEHVLKDDEFEWHK